MEAVRYDITAYTASFRLPGIMGYQTTAPVPPPSTIFGLISAAAGRDVTPYDLDWIAYRFSSDAKVTDLEKIISYGERGPYQEEKLGGINTVPIKREFLYSAHLVLYLPPNTFERAFQRPRYPICLGRSSDLATVESTSSTLLERTDQATVDGVLIPFPSTGNTPASAILSFPTYMQPTIPRTPAAVKMFHVITRPQQVTDGNMYVEQGGEWGVPVMTREFLLSNGG